MLGPWHTLYHSCTYHTAKGLTAALAWGGDLQNSFVQLISLDRPKLANLGIILALVVEKMKNYFSRLNDVTFLKELDHGYLLPCMTSKLYARLQLPSECE